MDSFEGVTGFELAMMTSNLGLAQVALAGDHYALLLTTE